MTEGMEVVGILGVFAFAVGMYVLNRWLRRAERDGNYDPEGSSPAARPGLRFFFDYSERGWRNDGSRQRDDG